MNSNLNEMTTAELNAHANKLFDIWQDVQSEYAYAAQNGENTATVAKLARKNAIAETAYDEAFTLLQVRTYEKLQAIKNRAA